ncbi:MAG: hypothetical protein AAF394_03210 [Planctomycetota bacterium]
MLDRISRVFRVRRFWLGRLMVSAAMRTWRYNISNISFRRADSMTFRHVNPRRYLTSREHNAQHADEELSGEEYHLIWTLAF